MKRTLLAFACLFAFFSIRAQSTAAPAEKGAQYGAPITAEGAIAASDLDSKVKNNQFTGKIKGKVTDVCLKKGCWMKIKKDDGEKIMVTFKDYEFFMPANIVDKEVVIAGTADIKDMSVKQQKHYAADAHMSKAEIDKIKEPKKETQFVANGVLVL
ncbi:MAG: DUF4920 domain-containing protein [Williamsia sp.]|nr:DUF4920 domain-containing protein [Williamsia sp.]